MNPMTEKTFPLTPPSRSASVFVFLIVFSLFIASILLWYFNPQAKTPIPSAVFPITVFVLPSLIIFMMFRNRNPNVMIKAQHLCISANFLNKKYLINDIDVQKIKIINLEKNKEFSPRIKIWGAAIPGLRSGYFKLRNGDKANVYITQTSKILYIPHTRGLLMLSIDKPDELLHLLMNHAC